MVSKEFLQCLAFDKGAAAAVVSFEDTITKYFGKFNWMEQKYITKLKREKCIKPKIAVIDKLIKSGLKDKAIKGNEITLFRETLLESYDEGYEFILNKLKEVADEKVV